MSELKKKKKMELVKKRKSGVAPEACAKAAPSPAALKTTKRKVYVSRSGCILLSAINYELNNVQLNGAKWVLSDDGN